MKDSREIIVQIWEDGQNIAYYKVKYPFSFVHCEISANASRRWAKVDAGFVWYHLLNQANIWGWLDTLKGRPVGTSERLIEALTQRARDLDEGDRGGSDENTPPPF